MLNKKDKDIIVIETDDIIKDPNMTIECHIYDLDENYIKSNYNVKRYTIDEGIFSAKLDINATEQEIGSKNTV